MVGLLGSSLLNHFGGLGFSDRSDKAGSSVERSASPTSKLSIVDGCGRSDSTSGTCGGVWGPFVGAKRGQAVTGYACLEIQAACSWVGHLMLFFPNRISAARLLTTPCRWALEDPFRPTTVAPRDCLSPSPSEPPPSTTHPSGLDSPGLGWSIHPLFSNCLSLSFP